MLVVQYGANRAVTKLRSKVEVFEYVWLLPIRDIEYRAKAEETHHR